MNWAKETMEWCSCLLQFSSNFPTFSTRLPFDLSQKFLIVALHRCMRSEKKQKPKDGHLQWNRQNSGGRGAWVTAHRMVKKVNSLITKLSVAFCPFRFNHSEDPDSQMVDAYVNVDCDEYHIGKTVTRPRTKCPVWNEDYQVSRVDWDWGPDKTKNLTHKS